MEQIPPVLPVLPIRNAVVFPMISMPLVVGRPRSLQALEHAEEHDGLIVIVTQRILTAGDPTPEDLYRIGTVCKVESSIRTDTGGRQIVVTGIGRYHLAEVFEKTEPNEGLLLTRGELVADTHSRDNVRAQALMNNLKNLAREILELIPGATEPLIKLVDRVDDPSYLSNVCAAYLNLSLTQKQELLETVEVEKRIDSLLAHMQKEREVLNLQREIRDKMSERLNKAQREALLREQLRTIRAELGEEGTEEAADELSERIARAGLPEEAQKQANEELKRLKSLPAASAEYHVVRTYLEWLANMPWKISTPDNIDIARARKILDEDHSGLEQVKKRILQFLAVAKLKNDLHGPILCLVGPPGVGKTSLGQSIARALGRKFIRTSLGGVRDEAEIRGHRRTYVGAMPGRIIQSIKRAGSRNPVMMLDEIDKLRADFHGDPSAAMLEVLDPEQNKNFTDHYIDVPFDLSDVFFIATANVLDTVPSPLRDRMEVIEVNGYTTLEKLDIARNHLLAKELDAHGFTREQIEIPDETLLEIIHHYTREAGVRELRRKIAALLRAAAEQEIQLREETQSQERLQAVGGTEPAPVSAPAPRQVRKLVILPEQLHEMLGPPRFFPELAEREMKPGVATGLAWTPHGGDLLFMEASKMPGTGKLILTGQLGDIMKESAQIALSLARSSLSSVLPQDLNFSVIDIHIHVPAGSIPKDGPSAGVTLLAALVSLLLGHPIEPEIGLTGEITLRGAVLPVGGIKEKVLAAHRAKLKRIVLPRRNERDLEEVPENVRKDIHFSFVETVEDVLNEVFGLGLGAERLAA